LNLFLRIHLKENKENKQQIIFQQIRNEKKEGKLKQSALNEKKTMNHKEHVATTLYTSFFLKMEENLKIR
jgi:hypothetical protein